MFSGNSTFLSWGAQKDGCHYSADFEYYPFQEGNSEAFFKGRWIGEFRNEGQRSGDKCIVRTCLEDFGTVEFWEPTMRIYEVANAIAEEFNRKVVKQKLIRISKPVLAEIDRLSAMNKAFKLFKRYHKKLYKGEMVLLEDYLPKAEFTFFLSPMEPRLFGRKEREVLEAFCHFSWQHSGGRYIICDLQGIKRGKTFILTDPKIHSCGEEDEEETRVLSPVCAHDLRAPMPHKGSGSMSEYSQSLSDVGSDVSGLSERGSLPPPPPTTTSSNEMLVEAVIESRPPDDSPEEDSKAAPSTAACRARPPSRDWTDGSSSKPLPPHRRSIKELREEFLRPVMSPNEHLLKQALSVWELRVARARRMTSSMSEPEVGHADHRDGRYMDNQCQAPASSSAPAIAMVMDCFSSEATTPNTVISVASSEAPSEADTSLSRNMLAEVTTPTKSLADQEELCAASSPKSSRSNSGSLPDPPSPSVLALYQEASNRPPSSRGWPGSEPGTSKFVDDTDRDSGVTVTTSSVEQDLNDHQEDSAYSSQGFEHFGPRDLGQEAVKSFFRNHLCNPICNTFNRPLV